MIDAEDAIALVYVAVDAPEAQRLRDKWERWGNGVRLVIITSPYGALLEPLVGFVENVARARQPGEMITIVVPQFVPKVWWHNLLHTQTAVLLRLALMFRKGIVVTDVPYQVD